MSPSVSLLDKQQALRRKLIALLANFDRELGSDDLRLKVRSLIPVYECLRKLGKLLVPGLGLAPASDRILAYMRKYALQIVRGEELMVVSGISDWPRRVRELRVQSGWHIISGVTAKEMQKEEELDIVGLEITSMKPKDYVLVSPEQDRDAAHRWHLANGIRKKKLSVGAKELEFLRANEGKRISGEELRYVANGKTEWARRVRELRTEHGWPIVTKVNGDPSLRVGVYVLRMDRQSPPHDRKIPDPVRREVLVRDNYRCGQCGWSYDKWNEADPRILELHHKQDHVRGGSNTVDNLVTLCSVHHDEVHRRSSRHRPSSSERHGSP